MSKYRPISQDSKLKHILKKSLVDNELGKSKANEVILRLTKTGSNIISWKESMKLWCLSQGNPLSTIITNNANATYAMANDDGLLVDLNGLQGQALIAARQQNQLTRDTTHKFNVEHKLRFQNDLQFLYKPTLYVRMWNTIDAQCKGLVESDPQYAAINTANVKEPLDLMLCIERQVVVRASASTNTTRTVTALSNLYSTHHFKDEYLSQYYKRFNSAIQEVKIVDEAKVPPAIELSMMFCKGLHPLQYGEQLTRWNQDDHAARASWPEDHNIAFNFLMQAYPNVKPITSVKGKADSLKPTGDVAYSATGKRKREEDLRSSSPAKECTHCNKKGHIVDTCWVLHPELRRVALDKFKSKKRKLSKEENYSFSSLCYEVGFMALTGSRRNISPRNSSKPNSSELIDDMSFSYIIEGSARPNTIYNPHFNPRFNFPNVGYNTSVDNREISMQPVSDDGCTQHVFHHSRENVEKYLYDVRDLEKSVLVGGLADGACICSHSAKTKIGNLDVVIGPSYCNLISETQAEYDGIRIRRIKEQTTNHKGMKVWITVRLVYKFPDPNTPSLIFEKRGVNSKGGGIYVLVEPTDHGFLTVEQLQSRYSKAQLDRVDKVRLYEKTLGYPGKHQMIQSLSNHILPDIDIKPEDVENYYKIHGPSIASLEGKTVWHTPQFVPIPVSPHGNPQYDQILYADYFFIDKLSFLMVVSVPLMMMFTVHMPHDRTALATSDGLCQVIRTINSRAPFKVTRVIPDDERTFRCTAAHLLTEYGVIYDPHGPKMHVPACDIRIRILKDRLRTFLRDHPMKLPKELTPFLVSFITSRMNYLWTSARPDGVTPRYAFDGSVLHVRQLRFAPGDFVHVTVPLHAGEPGKNDPRVPRTYPAIVLKQTGNTQGTWQVLSLDTGRVRDADQMTVVKFSKEHISYIESRLNILGITSNDENDNTPPPSIDIQTPPITSIPPIVPTPIAPIDTVPTPIPPSSVEDPPELNDDDSDDEDDGEIPEENGSIHEEITDQEQPALSIGDRDEVVTALLQLKGDYGYIASHSPTTSNSIRAQLKREASRSELNQLHNKEVWDGIKRKDVTPAIKRSALPGHMLHKEKFDAAGVFVKWKGRFATGGNMQDRSQYDPSSLSSPTVSLTSVLINAAIAAKNNETVVTIDITGAYLHAELEKEVYMFIRKDLVDILVQIDSRYNECRMDNGGIYVKLNKALYGLIEAAYLWFKHISSALIRYGFTQTSSDQCVFVKTSGRQKCVAMLYVDDIKVRGSDDLTEELITNLKNDYKEITVNRGKVHSYLGMLFDYSVPGQVKITMDNYMNELLEEYAWIKQTASTPAAVNFFEVVESELLSKEDNKSYRRLLARLYYPSFRIKPECIGYLGYLASRSNIATRSDYNKLKRILAYFRHTKQLGIVLRPGIDARINVYIDASFAIHSDGKSHTGVVVNYGSGPIYASSKKQSIVTKSSTEAELVGCSDAAGIMELVTSSLVETGERAEVPVVHQDNQSTIRLIRNGRATSLNSKHIKVRYFFLKEKCDKNEIQLVYTPTGEMIADILTKPLQGEAFIQARDRLINWYFEIENDYPTDLDDEVPNKRIKLDNSSRLQA